MITRYDNGCFAALRDAANKQSVVGLVELEKRLQALRVRCDVILDTVRTAQDVSSLASEQFQSLFRETWGVLSAIEDKESPYALPPMYETEALRKEIEWICEALISAECKLRDPGLDNAIYAGVRGTGKTTLLHATGAIASVLLTRVVPIYFCYEDEQGWPDKGAPVELMGSALQLFSSASVDLAAALASYAAASSLEPGYADRDRNRAALAVFQNEGNLTPLFLLDEFTTVYVSADGSPENSVKRARGEAIMRALHFLCKNCRNVIAMLATSCSNVNRFIYPERTAGSRLAISTYPNLNNQIFTARYVRPIRDDATLLSYLQKRYPKKLKGVKVDEAFVAAALHATGGSGRMLHKYATGRFSLPVDQTVLSGILVRPQLLSLFYHFLGLAQEARSSSDPYWLVDMSQAAALEVIAERSSSSTSTGSPLELLSDWCDEGILYLTEVGTVQVLVPALLEGFAKLVNDDADLRSLGVLALTLSGFDGGDPGKSNELFLCRLLAPTLGLVHEDRPLRLPEPSVSADGGFTAANPARLGEKGESEEVVTDVSSLLGRMLRWRVKTTEAGLDRIWLVQDGDRVVVHALQMKTGKEAVASLQPGVLDSMRKSPTDKSVAGILAKAERGCMRLVPALAACFPSTHFDLGSLVVYTTKPAESGVHAFKSAYPSDAMALRLLPADDAEVRALRAALRLRGGDPPLTLPWAFNSGTGWVAELLSEQQRKRLGIRAASAPVLAGK